MSEPGWAQVLTVLYIEGRRIRLPTQLGNLSEEHVLVSKTDLEINEIESGLNFLEEQKLIKIFEPTDLSETPLENTVRLTPGGFEVAHQRDLSYQEKAGNRAIVALTVILAITALIEGIISWVIADLSMHHSTILAALLIVEALLFLGILTLLERAGAFGIDELIERRRRHQR